MQGTALPDFDTDHSMAVHRTTSFFTQTILDDVKALNRSSKFELISVIWPSSGLSLQTFQEDEYASFTEYISQELSRLREHQAKFAAETIDATVDLIQVLRSNADRALQTVLQRVRERFLDVDEAAVVRSLELTTRLWLTINVHSESVAVGPVQANVGTIEWPSELSLRDLVHSQFQSSPVDDLSNEKPSKTQLDPSFTASSLVDICGMKIAWTHNLADHLNLDKRRRILTVYEHKICLLNHAKDADSLIPQSVLHEAIDTLNLLFPFGHGATRELLRREKKMALYCLGFCDRARVLALTDYNVWRGRVADLVEAFNEPPRDLKQLLSDRRNVMDWATFWIGMLVLVLTLLSIAFGTVSTVYAIKQYDLALAQACAVEGAALLLPRFCA